MSIAGAIKTLEEELAQRGLVIEELQIHSNWQRQGELQSGLVYVEMNHAGDTRTKSHGHITTVGELPGEWHVTQAVNIARQRVAQRLELLRREERTS